MSTLFANPSSQGLQDPEKQALHLDSLAVDLPTTASLTHQTPPNDQSILSPSSLSVLLKSQLHETRCMTFYHLLSQPTIWSRLQDRGWQACTGEYLISTDGRLFKAELKYFEHVFGLYDVEVLISWYGRELFLILADEGFWIVDGGCWSATYISSDPEETIKAILSSPWKIPGDGRKLKQRWFDDRSTWAVQRGIDMILSTELIVAARNELEGLVKKKDTEGLKVEKAQD